MHAYLKYFVPKNEQLSFNFWCCESSRERTLSFMYTMYFGSIYLVGGVHVRDYACIICVYVHVPVPVHALTASVCVYFSASARARA